jgi:small ligand-binding sensory domain FIST
MERDRLRVYQLLMMGRITAAEAERLMSAWQASRESTWILVGCIGIALATQLKLVEALPAVEHLARTLRVNEWMHGVLAVVVNFGGGLR